MSNIWSLYKNKIEYNGETKRERVINKFKNQIISQSEENVAFHNISINNEREIGVYITATQEIDKKIIQLLPQDTIDVGNIIIFKNLHWLVLEVDFNDELYRKATIRQCNRLIKLQNPKTLEIIERWCFVNKPYTSNLENGKTIVSLKGRFDVQLPYDEETVLLDVGKRLMFDVIDETPKVYKIEFADINTNKYEDVNGGFIEWTIISDTYTENDNKELMICDYKKQIIIETTPEKLSCEIIGNDNIKTGFYSTYNSVFYDKNMNVVKTAIPKWVVDYKNISEENFTIEYIDSDIKIAIENNNDIVNKSFDLILEDLNGNSNKFTKNIKVVGLFG